MFMRKILLALIAVVCCGVVSAQSGADAMLAKLDKYVDGLGAYKITFQLTSADFVSEGYCVVSGDSYYISVGRSEVYADGKARYEVDGVRREVNIDVVDTKSHNILDNPTRCFDFVGEDYSAEITSSEGSEVEIHLSGNDIMEEGDIYITIDAASGKPLSLLYTLYEDEAYIDIKSIASDNTPVKKFASSAYRGFEMIDFR